MSEQLPNYVVLCFYETEEGDSSFERGFDSIGEACKFAIQQSESEGYETYLTDNTTDQRTLTPSDWPKYVAWPLLEDTAWEHPLHYSGFSPDGDYLVMQRHRDSKLAVNCNWDEACERLKAEPMDHGCSGSIPEDRAVVYHWRAGHFAYGWVEYLMVRADAPAEIKARVEAILRRLVDYPILSEERLSRAEFEAVCDYWTNATLADRVHYLRDAELSIFAARRDELPEDPNGALWQALTEDL